MTGNCAVVAPVQEVYGAANVAVEGSALLPPGVPEIAWRVPTDDLEDRDTVGDLDHAAAFATLPLSFACFAEDGVPGSAPATDLVIDRVTARQGKDDHAALDLDPPAFVGLVPVVWVPNPGGTRAAAEEVNCAEPLGQTGREVPRQPVRREREPRIDILHQAEALLEVRAWDVRSQDCP